MNKAIIFILFFFPSLLSFSQKVFYSELRINSGFVAPHRIGMAGLAEAPTFGGEINLYYDFGKTNFYDSKYNSPYTGFGISWQNLGNPNALGQSVAVFSFMEFKLLELKQLSLNTRINGGLNYITKKYDPILNPENIAIGTNVCFYFNLNFAIQYQFANSPLSLRAAAGIIHFSNGSVRKPNLGLNQVNFALGAAYQLNKIERESATPSFNSDANQKHEFTAMATIINSDEYSVQPNGRGGGFVCSTGSIGYNYIYSLIGKVGASADVFYNENLYYWYDDRYDTLVKVLDTPKEILRAGISIGHELVYKRISFLSYVGLYYYKEVKPNELLYSRFGLRYYLLDNLFLNATIKAYGFKAHYIEAGVGFSIKNKPKMIY